TARSDRSRLLPSTRSGRASIPLGSRPHHTLESPAHNTEQEAVTVQTTRPIVLILTSLTGGGHLSLALALQDALSEHYSIEIAEPHPGIFHRYYTFVGRHFLRLWGLEYKVFDNEKAALRFHKILTKLLRERLSLIIEQIKPQLIITTH